MLLWLVFLFCGGDTPLSGCRGCTRTWFVVVRGRGLSVGAGGEERLSSLQVRSCFLFLFAFVAPGFETGGCGTSLVWLGLCTLSKPMSAGSGTGSGSESVEEELSVMDREMERIRQEWERLHAAQEQWRQERDRAAGARDLVAGGRQVAGQGAGQEERQGDVDRREPALDGGDGPPRDDQDMDVDGADQAVGPAAQLAWDTQERLGHLEASVGRIGAAVEELVNVLQERETRPRGPAAR